jgi:murein DD-endopeptidase MepM/ murein hydrolase activator NlpD
MRRWTTVIAGGLLAAAPAAALGATGGREYAAPPPAIGSVACRVDCLNAATARPGSLLRLKGRSMRRVATVTFVGAPGPRDDATVPAAQTTPRSVVVRVPADAVSGRLRVRTGDGALSRPSAATIAVGDAAAPRAAGEHVFPVRGPHGFGSAQARFGADRTDHRHEGQDVPAACGTPLVAARGGVVRWTAVHERAGNYVVIAGDGTGMDYAYMHLQAPALVGRGARVATGQLIGAVGDTGVASGCHLHFELWTAPGWHEGGSPIDPLPHLQAWDRP